MTRASSHHIQSPLSGTLIVPGDKSLSHRSLIFAAMADGETRVHGLLEGEDVLDTAQVLRDLGAKIDKQGDEWVIQGVGKAGFQTPQNPLNFGNSGTSARLICGVLAASGVSATMIGDASLSKRPFGRVTKPLAQMGAQFDGDHLPLTIAPRSSALKAIDYTSPIASAQVKSCILLAGLGAMGATSVHEPVISRDHTERLLPLFGVPVGTRGHDDGSYTASLTGPAQLTAPSGTLFVPADPSSAAFAAVAALMVAGSEITLPNIGMNPTRAGVFDTLRDMGAQITYTNQRDIGTEPVADLRIKGTGPLNGVTVPASRIASMIDEVPILAMIAATANGTTHIPNLAELRVKESDRLALVALGLQACGAAVEEGPDSLTIHGSNGKPLTGGATIAAELDHRIAMSFLVLGAITTNAITIDDITPINTSFPNFVDLMNGLGTQIDKV